MRPAKPFQAKGKWWIRVSNEFGRRKKKSFDSYADAMTVTHPPQLSGMRSLLAASHWAKV